MRDEVFSNEYKAKIVKLAGFEPAARLVAKHAVKTL
jgi:hypothetical protein